MKTRTLIFVALAIVGLGLCPQRAAASTLTITLDAPSLTGAPSTEVTFSGTIQNSSGSDVFLNGAGGSLSSPELTLDLTPFFTLTPLSLSDGDSYVGDIFAVAISDVILPGDYFGTFTIQGGADGSTFDDVAAADFEIQIPGPPDATAVPESPSGILVGLGGLALGAMAWLKASAG